MKDFGQVVRLISRQKLRKLDFLGDEVLGTRKTKLRELYDGLLAGSITNDRDGARLLYGAGTTDARWRQLKSRFRKKLFNTLLLVDADGQTDFSGLLAKAHRDLAQVHLLYASGACEEATAFAKTLFAHATQHDLAEITLSVAQLLLTTCSGVQHDGKTSPEALEQQRLYHEAMQQAGQEIAAAVEAEVLLRRIRQTHSSLCAIQEEPTLATSQLTMLKLGAKLDQLHQAHPNLRVQYAHAEAWILIAQQRHNPDLILRVGLPLVAAAQQQAAAAFAGRLRHIVHACGVAHVACGNWPAAHLLLEDRLRAASEADGTQDANAQTAALLVRLALSCGQIEVALQTCLELLQEVPAAQLSTRHEELWLARLAVVLTLAEGINLAPLSLKIQRRLRVLKSQIMRGGEDHHLSTWWIMLASLLLCHQDQDRDALRQRLQLLRTQAVRRLDRTAHQREIAFTQLLYRRERHDFCGPCDAVATRHLDMLLDATTQPEWQTIVGGADLPPCDLTLLLSKFGVDHMRLAA